MVQLIHARERPEGLRFRLWSTVVDAYLCEPMPCDAFVEWMRERGNDAGQERLARARQTGTSALWAGAEAESRTEWDTERCHACGGFHHAYAASADGSCSRCGEPRSDRAHKGPCK